MNSKKVALSAMGLNGAKLYSYNVCFISLCEDISKTTIQKNKGNYVCCRYTVHIDCKGILQADQMKKMMPFSICFNCQVIDFAH